MVYDTQLSDPILQAVPHRIVITGGPLAGKSTLIEHLQGAYDAKCRFMTEVATMLLSSGYPRPGGDVTYSDAWLDYVNKVILPTQLNMENGHLHAAAETHKRAVIFDRGLLDPAAYVPGGRNSLFTKYGLDVPLALDRYTMVIHMESLACISIEDYNRLCSTNPARYDSAEEAIVRDKALVEAWSDHPNWHFISADGGIECILAQALALISPLLDVEIEKKFKLQTIPDSVKACPSARIIQHYVYDSEQGEIRVRFTEPAKYQIAVKSNGGLKRTEWEQRIPSGIYENLANDPNSRMIDKRRYYVPCGYHTLEVDEYFNVPGLFTMECEFDTEAEADAFVLPEWAISAGAEDVTGHKEYSNARLARTKEMLVSR